MARECCWGVLGSGEYQYIFYIALNQNVRETFGPDNTDDTRDLYFLPAAQLPLGQDDNLSNFIVKISFLP